MSPYIVSGLQVGEPGGGIFLAPDWSLAPGEKRYLPSQGMVVSAVIFDNGTYEGKPEFAARLAAYQIGEQIQYERIKRLADEIIAGPTDDDANATLIQTQVRKLSEESAPWMVELLKKEFPKLPLTEQMTHFRCPGWLADGLRRMKSRMVNKLEGFKFQRYNKKNPRPTLLQWWNDTKQDYERAWGEMLQRVAVDSRCQGCGERPAQPQ
jgi:hypothetical protein